MLSLDWNNIMTVAMTVTTVVTVLKTMAVMNIIDSIIGMPWTAEDKPFACKACDTVYMVKLETITFSCGAIHIAAPRTATNTSVIDT